jgi:hypothetical protein
MTINCPHCGKNTVLGVSSGTSPTAGESKKVLGVAVALMVVITGAVVAFIWPQKQKVSAAAPPPIAVAAPVVPVTKTNKPVSRPVSQPAPVANTANEPASSTVDEPVSSTINDFDVSKISLQKTLGSGLVYAVGTLKNDVGRQRYGVKIVLNQLDEKGQNLGVVSDYVSVVDPQDTWRFKAVLTSPHVAKVTVAVIREQQ